MQTVLLEKAHSRHRHVSRGAKQDMSALTLADITDAAAPALTRIRPCFKEWRGQLYTQMAIMRREQRLRELEQHSSLTNVVSEPRKAAPGLTLAALAFSS